jgi:hypothetical protein
MTYVEALTTTAAIFRTLMPLGDEDWAISTYGLIAAAEGHARAAQQVPDIYAASMALEEAWSDHAARRRICSLVPYAYPPEHRAIGQARRAFLERADSPTATMPRRCC